MTHTEYMRGWRARNIERHRENMRLWRERNRERLRAYFRAWRAAHPTVRVNRDMRIDWNDPEQRRRYKTEWSRKWRENPENRLKEKLRSYEREDRRNGIAVS